MPVACYTRPIHVSAIRVALAILDVAGMYDQITAMAANGSNGDLNHASEFGYY